MGYNAQNLPHSSRPKTWEIYNERDRIIYGGYLAAVFLIPLFIVQGITTFLFDYGDIFNPDAVLWSLFIDLFLGVFLLLFLGVNIIARKIGDRAIRVHYASAICLMVVLAAAALVHMHFLGALHSMQTFLIMAVNVGFFWYIRKSHAYLLFLISNLFILIVLLLEYYSLLPYAPFLKKGGELGEIFLDPRVIGMNVGIFLIITATVGSVLIYFRESLEKSQKRFLLETANRLRLKDQLHQARKAELINSLTGGVTHDFDNILQTISKNVNVLMDQSSPDDLTRINFMAIKAACKRADELVDQMKTINKNNKPVYSNIDIAQMIKKAGTLFQESFYSSVKVEYDLDDNCGIVWADSSRLHQLVMNLFQNSFRASDEYDCRMKIEVKGIELDKKISAKNINLTPGKYVHLAVSYKGSGIEKEALPKIFHPPFDGISFLDGKVSDLSTVNQIIHHCHGQMMVVSEPEKGTIINLYFPVSQKDVAGETNSVKTEKADTSIMFVDDEEAIVEVSEIVLKANGYKFTGFTDPLDALDEFETSPDDFKIVVVDLTMPNMTGIELARKMKILRPNIPIVLSTGNTARIKDERNVAPPYDYILRKPYEYDELFELVNGFSEK